MQKISRKNKATVIGTFNGLTFAQWHDSTERIKWARAMMAEPMFRDMLAVLSNLRPMRQANHEIELGMRLGYDHILGVIQSLANFPQIDQAPIEADYGAAESPLK